MSDEKKLSALSLFENSSEAFLATSEESGVYVQAVGFLFEKPSASGTNLGKIAVFISDLARHTKNIRKNPNISLGVIEKDQGRTIFEKKRASAKCRLAEVLDPARIQELKSNYLAAYPVSKTFFTLPDFHFFEAVIEEIHYVGGFGAALTLKE